MKTQLTVTQNNVKRSLGLLGLFLMTMIAFNPIYAQTAPTTSTEVVSNEKTVKGIVSDDKEPLSGVNIILKGTKVGTATNEKGEFTFPKKLKTGDVLVFSYLGFITEKITIKDDTKFIKLVMSDDLVEMIGALDSAKPYKSKRKKN